MMLKWLYLWLMFGSLSIFISMLQTYLFKMTDGLGEYSKKLKQTLLEITGNLFDLKFLLYCYSLHVQ